MLNFNFRGEEMKTPQALEERLIDFAVNLIDVVESLPIRDDR